MIDEDPYHKIVSRAVKACNDVAKLLNVPEVNRVCMLDCARRSPMAAYLCYTAILRSYELPKYRLEVPKL